MALLAIWLILNRRKDFYAFDDNEIEANYVFAKKKTMFGKDVKVFNSNRKSLKVTYGKQSLGVNYTVVGFQSLLDAIKAKLDPSLWQDAMSKIDSFYKRMGISR